MDEVRQASLLDFFGPVRIRTHETPARQSGRATLKVEVRQASILEYVMCLRGIDSATSSNRNEYGKQTECRQPACMNGFHRSDSVYSVAGYPSMRYQTRPASDLQEPKSAAVYSVAGYPRLRGRDHRETKSHQRGFSRTPAGSTSEDQDRTPHSNALQEQPPRITYHNQVSSLLDDPRLHLRQWVKDEKDGEDIYHTGTPQFIVAGNGFRLCPAVLLNKELYLILSNIIHNSDEIRRLIWGMSKYDEEYLKESHMDEEKSKEWNAFLELRDSGEGTEVPNSEQEALYASLQKHRNRLTELLKLKAPFCQEIRNLRERNNQLQNRLEENIAPLFHSLVHRRFPKYGGRHDTPRDIDVSKRRQIPSREILTFDARQEIVNEAKFCEQYRKLVQDEFEIYRANYHFHFKQWAPPLIGSREFASLEQEFGRIWFRTTQDLTRKLEEANAAYQTADERYWRLKDLEARGILVTADKINQGITLADTACIRNYYQHLAFEEAYRSNKRKRLWDYPSDSFPLPPPNDSNPTPPKTRASISPLQSARSPSYHENKAVEPSDGPGSLGYAERWRSVKHRSRWVWETENGHRESGHRGGDDADMKGGHDGSSTDDDKQSKIQRR